MKKTLGGERLGSGNKMTVDLHGWERSTHDLGYIWRSTMAAGTLVPFMRELALPGDTFDINLNLDIKTHPTIGPLFGTYKAQCDVFLVPIRLYHSALHNNRLGIGMNMAQVKLPKYELLAIGWNPAGGKELDNTQINPSCILSYLGIRGVGSIGDEVNAFRKFNAIPFLAYWDIYKNYYANKQEEIGYVISNFGVSVNPLLGEVQVQHSPTESEKVVQAPASGTVFVDKGERIELHQAAGQPLPTASDVWLNLWDGTTVNYTDAVQSVEWDAPEPNVLYGFSVLPDKTRIKNWQGTDVNVINKVPPNLVPFPLDYIDVMRDEILKHPWNAEFLVNTLNLPPYSFITETYDVGGGELGSRTQGNQEGLAIKTYQSDVFNNWLSTEWIDGAGGINEITAVDVTSGKLNIDALQLSKKVYDMLNRIAVSGGSYNDWLDAQYDHDRKHGIESPVYMGGLIKELAFSEVVSNAAASVDGDQPLGTLAGRGVMGSKHKGGHIVIKVDEPSYIIGIVSLTPRLDYSQGNKWDNNLDTMNDLHVPALDQIGFQELIQEQMAWWTTNFNKTEVKWETVSAGKQPAWINYMTNVNEVRGNFAVRNNEMFMTLNRRYTAYKDANQLVHMKDLTTYIDPTLYNHIFAQTSRDAQNFWTQISIDITARRKMSAKVMPNL